MPAGLAQQDWLKAFRAVRAETERRAALCSRPKIRSSNRCRTRARPNGIARTSTWFFEQFLLRPHAENYRAFDERFAYLYNSYYVSAGPRAARPQRGLVTRPTAAEVAAYRAHVDAAVAELIETAKDFAELIPIIEIGLHHEQQHQELLLTDILHAFSLNETHPAYDPDWQWPEPSQRMPAAGATLAGIHQDRSRRRRLLFRQRTAGASGRCCGRCGSRRRS